MDFGAVLKAKADTTDLSRAEAAFDKVAVSAAKTEAAVDRAGDSMADALRPVPAAAAPIAPALAKVEDGAIAAGRGMGAMGGQAKQLGWQISQIAQQGAVTGNWMQAFAIQAGDIAMILGGAGGLGLAVGVLASVGLPLLGLAFSDAGDQAEDAADATEAYSKALSAVKSDLAEAKSLQDEYTQAVRTNNEAVMRAIEAEAKARQAKMRLDQIDLDIAQKAAKAQVDAANAAYSATSDRITQINGQIIALKDLQAAQQKAAMDGTSGLGTSLDYTTQLSLQQELLQQATQELLAQRDTLDRSSAEYDVVNTQVETMRAKMAANQDILSAIADGIIPPIADGLGRAAGNAGALYEALYSVSNLSFSNLPGVVGGTGSTGLGWGNTTNTSGFSLGGPVQAAEDAEYSLGVVTGAVTRLGKAAGGSGGAAPQVDDLTGRLDDLIKMQVDGVQAQNDAQIGALNSLGGAINSLTNNDIPGAINALSQLGQSLSGMGGMGSAFGSVAPMLGIFGAAVGLFDAIFGGNSNSGPNQNAVDRENLQRQLLAVQGKTEELRQMELATLSANNQKTQEKIWRLQDEAAVEAERLGLQQQLWALEGNTEAIRAEQLASLDESNQALQEQVWLLQDAAAAESERNGLLEQLYTLQGDTESLRALQLEGLDESNRALQEQIWALQDQKEAADKAKASILGVSDAYLYASQYDYNKAQVLGYDAYRAAPTPPAPTIVVPPPPPDPVATGILTQIQSTLFNMQKLQQQWNGGGLPTRAI